MNPRTHALRSGVRRDGRSSSSASRAPKTPGSTCSPRSSPSVLWFNRNNTIEGTALTYPEVTLPSILGALLVFGLYIGPLSTLAMEKEDGTLLRYKAAPHGMIGYVAGQVVYQTAQVVPSMAVILIPSLLIFDGVAPSSVSGWLMIIGVALLGILSVLPFGMAVGADPGVSRPARGMRPVLGLRHLGALLSDQPSLGMGPGCGTGVPDVLAGPGDAVGVPAGGSRRPRDRWLVEDARDGAGPDGLGRHRPVTRSTDAAAHGSTPVGIAGAGGARPSAAVDQMSDVVYNRIAMLRAERGISRRELAEALGVHYQTIGYLERGEYSPSLHLALRIAAHFDVPVEVVFSLEPFARLGSEARSG